MCSKRSPEKQKFSLSEEQNRLCGLNYTRSHPRGQKPPNESLKKQANGKTFFLVAQIIPALWSGADVTGPDPNTNSLHFAHQGGREEEGRAYLAGARRRHRARRRAPLVGHAQPSPPPGTERRARRRAGGTERQGERTGRDPRLLFLSWPSWKQAGQSGV